MKTIISMMCSSFIGGATTAIGVWGVRHGDPGLAVIAAMIAVVYVAQCANLIVNHGRH